MDPIYMPEAVVELIFSFLPVEDLLQCSLVSTNWREAINKNVTWKRHCSSQIDLENVKSVVRPAFKLPQSDCENLTPICKYRQKYMREVHLKNNFRHNSYVVNRKKIDIDAFKLDIGLLDCYIVGFDKKEKELCVWTIEDENPDKIHTLPLALNCEGKWYFKCNDKFCILVLNTLIQVYVLVDGRLTLLLSRIFDKEESFSENIPTNDSSINWFTFRRILTAWYSCTGIGALDTHMDTVGSYFVGSVAVPSHMNQFMHIWDLEKGKKLKKEIICGYCKIDSLMCNINSENLYIVINLYEKSKLCQCKIFCYSRKSMEEMLFYVELGYHYSRPYVDEQVIVLVGDCSSNLLILDAYTGYKITENFECNNIDSKIGDINNSVFVYFSEEQIIGMDMTTKETSFELSTDIVVQKLHLAYNNLLLVIGFKIKKIGLAYVFELWDIKTMHKLYYQEEEDLYWGNIFKQNFHELKVVFFQAGSLMIDSRTYW